jgi:hypothetical protein
MWERPTGRRFVISRLVSLERRWSDTNRLITKTDVLEGAA